MTAHHFIALPFTVLFQHLGILEPSMSVHKELAHYFHSTQCSAAWGYHNFAGH